MTSLTIHHNPRCSKSRQTLKLLEDRGLSPEIVLYLEEPPTAVQLDALARKLDMEPLAFMRTGEKLFRDLGLKKTDDRPRGEWLQIMAANPSLIERPIVEAGNRAALGRPPEQVLEIL